GPLAGRVGERVRERLEVVTGLDLHPHRTRDALREGPAERGLPHAVGSVYDRDGGRAGQPSFQEGEVLLSLQERGPFEVRYPRLHPSVRVEGGQCGQRPEAQIPPRLSQRRRPTFDFHTRRVDLAEDLPGPPNTRLRQHVDVHLAVPAEQSRIARLDESLALEALERSRDVAAQQPGALRDPQTEIDPMYNGAGVEIGVNVTLTHQGGEALQTAPTIIYVTSQRGTNAGKTDVQRLHLYNKLLATPSGIIDGTDTIWNVGERWGYKNFTLRSTDA